MMRARFAFSGMSDFFSLHVCVDLSFDLSGRLVEICLLYACTFFTGVPGSTKCPVYLVSDMASCLDICITDVEYAVSICLLV